MFSIIRSSFFLTYIFTISCFCNLNAATNQFVTSNADTNTSGTLRFAINQTNSNGGGTITIQADTFSNATITLTSDLPIITQPVTITVTGTTVGVPRQIINGNNSFQAFRINSSGTVSISTCAIQSTRAVGGNGGPRLSDQHIGTGGGGLGAGGGAFAAGNLILDDCTFTSTVAQGGSGGSGRTLGNSGSGTGGGGPSSVDNRNASGTTGGVGGGNAPSGNASGFGGAGAGSASGAAVVGGNGLFGGGGGGGSASGGSGGGTGGALGGNGNGGTGGIPGNGGGGGAAGGAVFVFSGTTTVSNTITLTSTSCTAGSGGSGSGTNQASNGSTMATDFFLYDAAALALNNSSGSMSFPYKIETHSTLTDAGVTKTGAGTVVLSSTSNSYKGGTTISAGTLSISADSNLGNSSGAITFSDGALNTSTSFSSSRSVTMNGTGTFDTDSSTTFTLNGVIGGTGGLTKSGSGNLVLTANNNYLGATTINAGGITLSGGSSALGNGSSLALNGGNLTLASGAGAKAIGALSGNSGSSTLALNNNTLTITQNSNQTYQGAITGATGGAITKAGASALTLSGACSYSGTTTINAGSLIFSGSTSGLTGQIANTSALIFNQSSDSTFGQLISGSGGTLEKQGAGNLTLSGDNNYTGTTTVTGGTLTLTGDITQLGADITNNATLVLNQSANRTFNRAISGTAGILTKSGSGTLTLTANNNYTGTTIISAGGINLSGGSSALGNNASLALNGGNLTLLSGAGAKSIGALSGNSGSSTLALNDNTLTITQDSNQTYQGAITGATGGAITKSGGSVLTLSGTVSYSGVTTINNGTLILSGNISGLTGQIANTAALVFNQASTSSFGQLISGTGGTLEKQGAGNLTLSADNNYTGTTTITAGTLTLTGDITQLGGNIINNAALVLNQSSDRTFNKSISGSGSLTKAGATTLTLTGNNSYSGGTTISAGTLIGDTNSLQGNINVGSNVIQFNQTSDGTYSGELTGNGTFTKNGAGALIFTGDSSNFTGNTNLQTGNLVINGPDGNLQGLITIASGAQLQGNGGFVGTVNNFGTLGPGAIGSSFEFFSGSANEIATINILGDYTQQASAVLEVELNLLGQSDLVAISGAASLNGFVNALPEDGVYVAGTQFLILTADGGYGNTRFIAVTETHEQDFLLSYVGNNVYLIVKSDIIISSFYSSLTGNAKRIYDYLFSTTSSSDASLTSLQNTLLALPTAPMLIQALLELCPAQYGAISLASFQNNVRFANLCLQKGKNAFCGSCQDNSAINVWLEPVGFYYNQKGVQQQFGFNDITYGVAGGMYIPLASCLFLNPSVGFTHTRLKWNNQCGKATCNTVYFSPSLGYSNGKFFANVIAQGDIDFYKACREISFIDFEANPKANFKSYDLLFGFEFGRRFNLREIQRSFKSSDSSSFHSSWDKASALQIKSLQKINFYIQPEFQFYYINLFRESFTEGSNSYVNLAVDYKHNIFLQPNYKLNFVTEFHFKECCIAPTIYLGGLNNIPVGTTGIVSKFYQMDIPTSHFSVEEYNRVVNQLSFGVMLDIAKCDHFQFSIGYHMDVLSHMNIQMINLKINWKF